MSQTALGDLSPTLAASKRNLVLEELRRQVVAVDGMHDERTHVGMVNFDRVDNQAPHVILVPGSEPQPGQDGDEILCRLTLGVGVLIRVDPLATVSPDMQLSATADPIYARLENLRDGVSAANALVEGGHFDRLLKSPSGLSFDAVFGSDQTGTPVAIRFVECEFTVEYRRNRGSAT
jgi:hypothetical protein